MDKEHYRLQVAAEENAKKSAKKSANESVDESNNIKINYPLYINCYSEALGAILKNIDFMEEENKEEQKRQKNRNANQFLLRTKNSDINCSEFANIIAFIGTRGSGKTTALNEFCDILSKYNENEEEWGKRLSYKNVSGKKYRFWIMPPIDASVLEAKEDLLELIWANMYQVFDDKFKRKSGKCDYDELSKRLMKEFDEVYKNYNNVGHSEKKEVMGDSILVKLKNISSSLKTREAFEKLIKNFLYMLDEGDGAEEGYYKNSREESYLVITVDDLDLNLEKGYEMLEQMHKYLFHRRIIVLIAIDYRNLRSLSEKYFIEALTPQIPSGAYNGNEVVHGELGNIVRKAKKLNNDYLLKVLPLSNRIYLSGGNIISKQITVSESEGKQETVKAFILKKIADKTLIYYDACGKKTHFCLPNTIRELTSYNQFLDSLYSMSEIEEGKERDNYNPMIRYDQNHDRFNYDITNRMAFQLLNEEQVTVFELIVQRNIERRAEYAVNFLSDYKKGDSELLKDEVDKMKYRYSDLLSSIYYIGRENYSDKKLGHCILASFTSEMVREYFSYCNNKSNQGDERDTEGKGEQEVSTNLSKAQERAKGRLVNYLGSTFGGEWFGNEMPKAVLKSGDNSDSSSTQFPIGYLKKNIKHGIKIEKDFPIDVSSAKGVERLIDDLTKEIPYLECVSLLCSNLRNKSGKADVLKWNLEIKSGKTSEGEKVQITMEIEIEEMGFDIFGFIGREIKDALKKDALCKSLYEMMQDELEKLWKDENEKNNGQYSDMQLTKWKERIEEKAKKASIWCEEDRMDGNVIYLPFYNLDMTYNVMKRVRNRTKEDSEVEFRDIAKYFKRVYGYIAEELDKEDKAYDEMKIPEQRRPKLLETFNSCPFIKKFGHDYKTEDSQKKQLKLDETKMLNESELSDYLSQIIKYMDTPINTKAMDVPE